jgi:hypothetical protein
LVALGFDVGAMERSCDRSVYHHPLSTPSRDVSSNSASSSYDIVWRLKGTTNFAGDVAKVSLNLAKGMLVDLMVFEGAKAFLKRLPADAPHAVAISELPDEPVYQLLKFGVGTPLSVIIQGIGTGYTNALSLLETPPAYERKMRQCLVEETRRILAILGCTQLADPKPENLAELYVTPPAFGGGGSVAFQNGRLKFDCEGKLKSFDFVPRGKYNRLSWWHSAKSLITTNEAYQIATQKLAALSIDMDYLNTRYRRYLWRLPYKHVGALETDGTRKREWRESPEYRLVWRDTSLPPQAPSTIKISVYGDLKEVGTIELNDTACWRRPPVVETNAPGPL